MTDTPTCDLSELFGVIDRTQQRPFEPFAYYNAIGDALEVYLSKDERVAERVDDLFTVFVADSDPQRVVGLVVKNIKRHFADNLRAMAVGATAPARVSVSFLVYGMKSAVEMCLSRSTASPRSPESSPELAPRLNQLLHEMGRTKVELRNVEDLVSSGR